MDGQYSKERLTELFGEATAVERYMGASDGELIEVLVFGCGCRAMPNGDRFVLSPPCDVHGTLNVVRISDRRCGPLALATLSFYATGLLAHLVRYQESCERDAAGCAHVSYHPDVIERDQSAAEELIEARILTHRPDGSYELNWFTCFDKATGEWY